MSMRTAAAAAMPLPRSGTWPRRSCARSRNANCAGYDIWRFLPLRGLCLPPPEGEDCRDGETEQRPSRGFGDLDGDEDRKAQTRDEDRARAARRELLDVSANVEVRRVEVAGAVKGHPRSEEHTSEL